MIQLELRRPHVHAARNLRAVSAQLKHNAEARSAKPVTEAVITVPAYFNDAQRQATKDAGRHRGPRSSAAGERADCRVARLRTRQAQNGIIAVYDFGGGTFDISILKLHDGIFEVLATNGDTHLGGDDIDNLLLRIALEDIASEWGAGSLERQRRRAAAAPCRDSTPRNSCRSSLTAKSSSTITAKTLPARDRSRVVRTHLITPIVDRTLGPCRACMQDAELTSEQIDEVVMVGGSTRIPLVRGAVETLFRAKPHTELNPDEVVALGAAVQAGILARRRGGQAAARRDAALARHRDDGRRGFEADPSQFDHPRERHAKRSPPAWTASATF